MNARTRGYRIVVIICASQAREAGSIPATRSIGSISLPRLSSRPSTPLRAGEWAWRRSQQGSKTRNSRKRIRRCSPLTRGWASANLAQLVEQCFRKAEVPGSNPGIGSIIKTEGYMPKGRAADKAAFYVEKTTLYNKNKMQA